MNSYPSDESIRPEEQPNLISEIDSKGISITPTESTPQLDVRSESGTITVLTDGGSKPAIRIQNRLRILQEARKRKQCHEARWRKHHNENVNKLMMHMMDHAKKSSKVYLKNLYECFNRGEGQLFNLFPILLNPVLILDSRFLGDTYIWGVNSMHFSIFFYVGCFSGGGGIWDFFWGGGGIPPGESWK